MKQSHILIILLLYFILIFCNGLWLYLNSAPIDIEGMDYLMGAKKVYSTLFENGGDISSFLNAIGPRTPLPCWVAAPFIAGKSIDLVIFFTSAIYTFILAFSIYKITSYFFGERAAIISAVISLVSTGVWFIARTFFPDLCLAAFVALCLLLLFKTDGFKNKKYSLLAGILCGLGGLAKWQFFLYLLPFCFYFIFRKLAEIRNSVNGKSLFAVTLLLLGILHTSFGFFIPKFRVLWFGYYNLFFWIILYFIFRKTMIGRTNLLALNILDFFIMQLVMLLPFYLYHNIDIWHTLIWLVKSENSSYHAVGPFLSFQNLSYYLFKIFFEHFGLLIGIYLLISFVLLIIFGKLRFGKKNRVRIILLLSSFLFVLIIFTIIENKDPRHIFPAIVFLMPLLGLILSKIWIPLNFAFTFFAILYCFSLTFNIPISSQIVRYNSLFDTPHWWIDFFPRSSSYEPEEIIRYFSNGGRTVCLFMYFEGLTPSDFQWGEYVLGAGKNNYVDINFATEETILQMISGDQCDYILLKPYNPGWKEGTVSVRNFYSKLEYNNPIQQTFKSNFELLARLNNSNDSNDYVEIYLNKGRWIPFNSS